MLMLMMMSVNFQVSENLKFNSALLSRFDLVFILLDTPDAHHDQMIGEHILRIHNLSEGEGLVCSVITYLLYTSIYGMILLIPVWIVERE